jgi:hypothetical protein
MLARLIIVNQIFVKNLPRTSAGLGVRETKTQSITLPISKNLVEEEEIITVCEKS